MEGYLVVSFPSSMFHVVDCLHHIVLLTPDAESSAAKKEDKKSEAKTEAKPRSVLTARKKSSDNTGNQTGSIRFEDPNTDVLIHAAVKDGKKKRHQETMFPSLQFVMSASFVNLSA